MKHNDPSEESNRSHAAGGDGADELSSLMSISVDLTTRTKLNHLLANCTPLTHQRQSELLKASLTAQHSIRMLLAQAGYPIRLYFDKNATSAWMDKSATVGETDGKKISAINSRIYQQWLNLLNESEQQSDRGEYTEKRVLKVAEELAIFDCSIILAMAAFFNPNERAWSGGLSKAKDIVVAMATIRNQAGLIQRNKDLLVKTNLRMVAARAFEASGRHIENPNISVEDLFQEGVLGLMTAIDRFDDSHGTRLSTYADPRIRQKIQRFLANHRTAVRVPVHTQEAHSKAYRKSVTEGEGAPKPPVIHTPKQEVSLNTPISGDADQVLGDVIADEVAARPDDAVNRSMAVESLEAAMGLLNPVDREIVLLRNGMPSAQTFVLAQIESDFALAHVQTADYHLKAEKRGDPSPCRIKVLKALR
jgi:RNA polymerase sigma factor (sigma-70 family)